MYERDPYLCSIYIQLLILFRSIDLERMRLEDRIKTSKNSLRDFRSIMTVECVPLRCYAVAGTDHHRSSSIWPLYYMICADHYHALEIGRNWYKGRQSVPPLVTAYRKWRRRCWGVREI